MKIGILGTGFGSMHAEWISSIAGVDEVVVWGRNKDKLNSLKEKLNVNITTDMDDIYNDPDIALVDICMPDQLHKECAVEALGKGKNVFCEVPVFNSVTDASEIYDLAEQNGCLFMSDSFLKFTYAYNYLYEAKSQNKYGKLQSLKLWRQTPPWWGKLGEKEIAQLLIHDIDYISWLLGSPNSISILSSFLCDDKGVIDICLKFDESNVILSGSSMMPGKHPFSIGYDAIFEKAVIKYYDNGYCDHQDKMLQCITEDNDELTELSNENSYVNCLTEAIRAVRDKTKPVNGIAEIRRTTELFEMIQKEINK